MQDIEIQKAISGRVLLEVLKDKSYLRKPNKKLNSVLQRARAIMDLRNK